MGLKKATKRLSSTVVAPRSDLCTESETGCSRTALQLTLKYGWMMLRLSVNRGQNAHAVHMICSGITTSFREQYLRAVWCMDEIISS